MTEPYINEFPDHWPGNSNKPNLVNFKVYREYFLSPQKTIFGTFIH